LSVAAARSAARAASGARVRSAAQPGKAPWLASTSAVARPLFFPPRFEHTKPRILPRDWKQPVAPGAHQLDGVLAERCARAAARAYAVGRSPARRRMLCVGEPCHDGPRRGTKWEDLEEAARHRHRSSVHLEHAFERRRADDAVPRAPPHLTAGADSRASPLVCMRHDRPPERRGVGCRVALGAQSQSAGPWKERLGRGSQCRGPDDLRGVRRLNPGPTARGIPYATQYRPADTRDPRHTTWATAPVVPGSASAARSPSTVSSQTPRSDRRRGIRGNRGPDSRS